MTDIRARRASQAPGSAVSNRQQFKSGAIDGGWDRETWWRIGEDDVA
jgi:hypothetical protein